MGIYVQVGWDLSIEDCMYVLVDHGEVWLVGVDMGLHWVLHMLAQTNVAQSQRTSRSIARLEKSNKHRDNIENRARSR